ncbi:hypothetical protein GCM10011575_45160 [Microlunatus endophyticus]|uniref:Uncharacterized protein n=1 Tax=Microlunatus endophyticus TaxID=1716077 RepID=A0A917W9M2_9ACTN|nr:hypothetical protein [Microlunatus endophyticus]GGL81832.1 hypothetical protein GCM10011575_45160 [Microlunatus endophyticus]
MPAAHGSVVAIGVLLFALALIGLVVLTWLGLRDGDELDDLKVTIDDDQLRPPAGRIAVQVENPGTRPVVITVRIRSSSRAAAWLGTPVGRRTLLRRVIMPPDEAVVEVVPAATIRRIVVTVDEGLRGPYLRVDTTVYDRPGRVRRISHQLAYVPDWPDLDHAASRRSASS